MSIRSVPLCIMNRWTGKVAIVTGASSGIGAAIAKSLVNHDVKVVGLARRIEKLEELEKTLGKDKFYPIQCDLEKEEDILSAFKKAEEKYGGVDILVNNAGVGSQPIIDTPTSEYRKTIDTNLIAPAICAREFTQSIRKRDVFGHIININSVAGRFAEAINVPLGMYPASKYALRALGIELRHEFMAAKLRIKVTNISPGAVHTEMLERFCKNRPEVLKTWPLLKDQDIADATIYTLGTPESTEILEVTVMPKNAPTAIHKAT